MTATSRSRRRISHLRLRVVMIGTTMLLSLFAVRLIQLQGIDPKAYAARAQAAGAHTQVLPAKRGEITDRNGKVLAESVNGEMIVADPVQTAAHATQIARILATQLGLDYFDTLAKLSKPNTRYQELARRIPSTKAAQAMAKLRSVTYKDANGDKKNLAIGLYTSEDPLRKYPANDVGASIIGFATGARSGLEASFNKRLSGTDGNETYDVGGDGQRIPLGENSTTQPVDGSDIQLTIDRDLQWYVQRVLQNAIQNSRSTSGYAVVLDTQTGEILALANYPTFDANNPGITPIKDIGNPAVSAPFEPGSVQKVLTFSALIDDHLITPRTKITVPSELPVQDRVIHDWFTHPTLHLTATGVIAKSSNIGTSLAATQLTNEQLYSKLRSFGLGSSTGIGLLGESAGIVPVPQMWQKINHATISFGQGISVTALQMAAAVNAIANGGVYVSPSLIKGSAKMDNGRQVGTDYTTSRRVISKSAAGKVSRMMEMVPNPNTGTAPGAQVAGYRVSGKTGTAQEVNPKCRCYDGRLTVSFAGFAPADNPRFTVYVVANNPHNGGGGGSIGGPAFSKIMTYLLNRYSVPPTGTKPANLPVVW